MVPLGGTKANWNSEIFEMDRRLFDAKNRVNSVFPSSTTLAYMEMTLLEVEELACCCMVSL